MNAVPICPAMGVEVSEIDAARPLDADKVDELRRLFAHHHLLLVRNQQLTPEQHERFCGYLAPLAKRTIYTPQYISNLPRDKDPTSTGRLLFHSDTSGSTEVDPPGGLSLYAIEVAESGPPTAFASGVNVYRELPAERRRFLETLKVVEILLALQGAKFHTEREYHRIREADIPADTPPEMFYRVVHPLIKQLTNSALKTVYVSEMNTSHIGGLPLEESEAILQELFKRLYRESNVYTHRWRIGDVIVWDNIALQHARTAQVDSAPRRLHRVTLGAPYS